MGLENNMTSNTHNIEFDNPAFDGNSIYDSISRATGSPVAANMGPAYEGNSHEHGKGNITTNKTPSDDSNTTYQALDKAAVSPEIRYASLHQKKEYPGENEGGYTGPVHSQSEIPRRTSGTATDDDIYENLKFEDESGA